MARSLSQDKSSPTLFDHAMIPNSATSAKQNSIYIIYIILYIYYIYIILYIYYIILYYIYILDYISIQNISNNRESMGIPECQNALMNVVNVVASAHL